MYNTTCFSFCLYLVCTYFLFKHEGISSGTLCFLVCHVRHQSFTIYKTNSNGFFIWMSPFFIFMYIKCATFSL